MNLDSNEVQLHLETDSDTETDSEIETDSDEPADGLQTQSHQSTIWIENVPTEAFTIWNFMARSFGATHAFTYNGTSLCHFEDSTKGMHFAMAIASHPNLPLLTDMIEENTEQYFARIQDIKDHFPNEAFTWEEI